MLSYFLWIFTLGDGKSLPLIQVLNLE